MRNFLYSIGITGFLAMMVFTLATSLSNPYYGMSEEALAQGSMMSTTVECDCQLFGGDCAIDGWGATCAPAGEDNCGRYNSNCN